MKKYKVLINDLEYNVELDCLDKTENFEQNPEIAFEAVKNEYDHCVNRSDRLDNKIYILLTICAFIFAFTTSPYAKLSSLQMPKSVDKLLLLIIFILLMIINTTLMMYLLYKLIGLLKGQSIKRLDPMDILKEDVYSHEKKIIARTISVIYLDAMTYNNMKLENRFQIFNKCSQLLFPVIVLSVIVSILSNYI